MSNLSTFSADSLGSSTTSSRSFENQFEQQRERLRQVARARMHPLLLRRVDTDDVIQEAFLAARPRFKQWKQNVPVSFFIWLRTITIQTIQNLHRYHLRSQCRTVFQEQRVDASPSTNSCCGDVWAGPQTTPSQAAIAHESLKALNDALQQLSPGDREIIVLRSLENLSNQEVATCLGIGTKAASIRYIRALDRLRQRMSSLLKESEVC